MQKRLHEVKQLTSAVVSALAWSLGAIAGAFACAGAVRLGGGSTPIDHSLPLVALCVGVAAWLIRDHAAAFAVQLAIPLLAVAELLIVAEPMRLLAFGLIVAAALATTVAARTHAMRIPLTFAASVTTLIVLMLRWLPPAQHLSSIEPFVLLSTLAALAAAARRRDNHYEIDLRLLPVVCTLALVTPVEPWRASFLPLAIAATMLFVRTRSGFFASAAVVLALAGGKVVLLLVAIPLIVLMVAPLIVRERAFASAPLLARLSASGATLLRAFTLAPWLAVDTARFDSLALVIAIELLAALFSRPAIAPWYLLASAAFVVARDAGQSAEHARSPRYEWLRNALTLPSFVLLVAMVALFPWSGVAARMLPLPLATTLLLLLLLFTIVAQSGSLVAAMLGLLLIIYSATPALAPPVRQVLGRSIARGESVTFDIEPHAGQPSIVASGANIAALKPGTPLGSVEVRDSRGRVTRVPLVVGDIADWGFMRRDFFFAARNEVPHAPAGMLAEYGTRAWIGGSGRVPLPFGDVRTISVTGAASLRGDRRLQLDAIEWRTP